MILEHHVVGDRHRYDDGSRVGLHGGMQQAGFRGLELPRVAPPPLEVEEQVVALEQLGDVCLERHQVCRVLCVPANGNRTRHMPVNQPERAAEQIDARGNDGRPDSVVVEHQRLDQVVDMALVVRDVDDTPRARRLLRDLDMLVDPFNLPEDGIERMLQRTVDGVSLRRSEFVEVGMDPLARLELRLTGAATQIARYFLAREDCLGDVIEHHGRTISDS